MRRPSAPIALFTLESRLKRRLRDHLRAMGYTRGPNGELVPPSQEKDVLREMHALRRKDTITKHRSFITKSLSSLRQYFASGLQVVPEAVSPRLEVVMSGTWQADLFRLASLTWSMPVSSGYGRRIRLLVWDDSNEKLIGLLALGDPVFNLRARDGWVGWSSTDREKRLVNVLDAFVLGAVPPYSQLLGGKLIASLVRSSDIRDFFDQRYGNRIGIISGQSKHASLVMVTTTSAFGRSSLYNRLTLNSETIFEPLGFSSGFGHFHIPDDLFRLIRDYLETKSHTYRCNFEFGDGPNWRMRAIKAAFGLLNVNPALLRHGVEREVFACRLASNAKEVLRGSASVPDFAGLRSASEQGALARERWLVPRAIRRPDFRSWVSSDLDDVLFYGLAAKQNVPQRAKPPRANHGTR